MSKYFVLWHGLGWLALVFLGGFYALFDAVLPPSSQHLSAALAYICSAPPCWFLGRYLRAHYTRMVKDKDTGEKIRVRQPKHGLFFIPMHWLGVVFLVVGVGLVIDGAGKSQPPPHVALREAEPLSPGTSNWVTFSPPSGDFTVSAPAALIATPETINSSLGPIERNRYHVVGSHDTYFAVERFDYPADFHILDLDQSRALDGARDGAVATTHGRLIDESPIVLGRFVGRQIKLSIDAGRLLGIARLYLVGDRLYQGIVVRRSSVTDDDTTRFLDSLHITGE